MGCFNEKEAHQALWDGKKLFFYGLEELHCHGPEGFGTWCVGIHATGSKRARLVLRFQTLSSGRAPVSTIAEFHCGWTWFGKDET